ncbi:MAG: hypothetical protein AAGK97_01755 [Bacteroidota bacterium]
MKNSNYLAQPVLYESVRYSTGNARFGISRSDFGLTQRHRTGNNTHKRNNKKMIICKIVTAASIVAAFYLISMIF